MADLLPTGHLIPLEDHATSWTCRFLRKDVARRASSPQGPPGRTAMSVRSDADDADVVLNRDVGAQRLGDSLHPRQDALGHLARGETRRALLRHWQPVPEVDGIDADLAQLAVVETGFADN